MVTYLRDPLAWPIQGGGVRRARVPELLHQGPRACLEGHSEGAVGMTGRKIRLVTHRHPCHAACLCDLGTSLNLRRPILERKIQRRFMFGSAQNRTSHPFVLGILRSYAALAVQLNGNSLPVRIDRYKNTWCSVGREKPMAATANASRAVPFYLLALPRSAGVWARRER